MAIETEIKFRLDDPEAFAGQLEAAGFHLETPRAFESNTLYDTADRQLRQRTEILRIRGYNGRWTVTHKRPPAGSSDQDLHKHRIETETSVEDGDVLAEIFRSMGLAPSFRYEKYRSEWSDGEGHCVIDETPIGIFAELEGDDDWIDRVAERLGVDKSRYLTLSYGRLFDLWRVERGASIEHLTFAAVSEVGTGK